MWPMPFKILLLIRFYQSKFKTLDNFLTDSLVSIAGCLEEDWMNHKDWCKKNSESKLAIRKHDCEIFKDILKDVISGKIVPKSPAGCSYDTSVEAAD